MYAYKSFDIQWQLIKKIKLDTVWTKNSALQNFNPKDRLFSIYQHIELELYMYHLKHFCVDVHRVLLFL